mmetsp:Transcript_172/g.685  ORF Transcript_172/g.685 Transcript_172/m.685 type:complete len:222 (-) Transcript_172:458-1123(-)
MQRHGAVRRRRRSGVAERDASRQRLPHGDDVDRRRRRGRRHRQHTAVAHRRDHRQGPRELAMRAGWGRHGGNHRHLRRDHDAADVHVHGRGGVAREGHRAGRDGADHLAVLHLLGGAVRGAQGATREHPAGVHVHPPRGYVRQRRRHGVRRVLRQRHRDGVRDRVDDSGLDFGGLRPARAPARADGGALAGVLGGCEAAPCVHRRRRRGGRRVRRRRQRDD